MLFRLHINQVALIESLEIEFTPSLNILTGETGAGKSIIIDAVNLALGERASKTLIRSGAQCASVEAIFTVDDDSLALNVLRELDIPVEDGMIIVSRELHESGKNICRISGKLVTLSVLKQVSDCLMDVHGQHEHQTLIDPANHVLFLDQFGGEAINKRIDKITAEYEALKASEKKLQDNFGPEDKRLERMDFLEFRINEIKSAELSSGEDEKLTEERNVLRNAQLIKDSLLASYDALSGDDINAMMCLKNAKDSMQAIASYDPRYETACSQLEDVYYSLEDITLGVRDYKDSFEYNPARLEEIEERLAFIHQLQRKYSATTHEILLHCEVMEDELSRLKNADNTIKELNDSISKSRHILFGLCTEISMVRQEISKQLQSAVQEQLADLGMPNARFEVSIVENRENITPSGWDRVEFMLSANAGESLKPLAKVASGGEMSRIMLALKSIGGDIDKIPGMVFDEIDTGISGRIAEAVGIKLCAIARERQVICVTHLPQIACLADSHFVVNKTENGNKTNVSLALLDREGRIKEVAKLAAGSNITDTSLKHSAEMISEGEKLKTLISSK